MQHIASSHGSAPVAATSPATTGMTPLAVATLLANSVIKMTSAVIATAMISGWTPAKRLQSFAQPGSKPRCADPCGQRQATAKHHDHAPWRAVCLFPDQQGPSAAIGDEEQQQRAGNSDAAIGNRRLWATRLRSMAAQSIMLMTSRMTGIKPLFGTRPPARLANGARAAAALKLPGRHVARASGSSAQIGTATSTIGMPNAIQVRKSDLYAQLLFDQPRRNRVGRRTHHRAQARQSMRQRRRP